MKIFCKKPNGTLEFLVSSTASVPAAQPKTAQHRFSGTSIAKGLVSEGDMAFSVLLSEIEHPDDSNLIRPNCRTEITVMSTAPGECTISVSKNGVAVKMFSDSSCQNEQTQPLKLKASSNVFEVEYVL